MRFRMGRITLAASTLGLLGNGVPVAAADAAAAADAEPRAALAVRVYESHAAAGLPIVLRLTVTNTGHVPFSYVYAGPGRYPSAHVYTAVVVGQDGGARELRLSNGQNITGGSSWGVSVRPGGATSFLAALGPLPTGRHTIRAVWCKPSGHVTRLGGPTIVDWPAMSAAVDRAVDVRDGAGMAERFGTELLNRVRSGDPFAQHVAAKFGSPAVVRALVADLEADDARAVTNAAHVIGMRLNGPKPDGLGEAVRRAVAKRLGDESPNWNALAFLASLAEQDGSDASLDAVLTLVSDERAIDRDPLLVQELFGFKQPRATDALRRFAAHPDSLVRHTAAVGLSKRKEERAAAVSALIAVTQDPAHPDRGHAFRRLADYPDDPRAVTAIEVGTRDPDERARQDAASARDSMEFQRAPHGGAATVPATKPVGTGR